MSFYLLPFVLALTPSSDLHSHLLSAGYQSHQIEKLESGHDAIAIRLNGVEATFLIDTGAGNTVLATGDATEFVLDRAATTRREPSPGAGGMSSATFKTVNSLTIDQIDYTPREVAILELNAIFGQLEVVNGRQLHGILGQDILAAYSAVLDATSGWLYLRPVSAADEGDSIRQLFDGADYHAIDLERLVDGHQTVEGSINGKSARFVLDSGAGRSVINRASMDKLSIHGSDANGNGSSAGSGGAFSFQRFGISSLRLGTMPIDKQQIAVANLQVVIDALAASGQERVDGVIGQDVLT